jgi:ATP-binding cassette subfamily F protein 3
MRILLLGQTRQQTIDERLDEMKIEDETVLQYVVRSDKVRENYLKEAESKSEIVIQIFRLIDRSSPVCRSG